jgi:hypothetical protein
MPTVAITITTEAPNHSANHARLKNLNQYCRRACRRHAVPNDDGGGTDRLSP